MKDNLLYVNHILDNIEKIESFSKNYTKSDFLKDELVQYAVIRAIEVIGEAVKNMSLSIKNKHSEIAWKDISGTRDILIHHYFGVDLDIVWDIVKKQIPELKKKVIKIKNEF